jgi:dCMP deaminase
MGDRPNWDEYFKNIVIATSTRSSCPFLKVGCLFVKDNRIIAQGYNGHICGCQHKIIMRNNYNIATIHAEQNTITDCAKRGVSCNECVAYITHYPCYNCMKLMLSSGIKNIKYINDFRNDVLVQNLANETNVSITKI